jgi:putative oxidoreductase
MQQIDGRTAAANALSRAGDSTIDTQKEIRNMIRRVFETDDSITTAVLRLVLGVVFFAHGAQKMLGWFGGYGFSGTMGFFTGPMHIPALFAFLAIAAEFFGGIGLILGFLTRIAAFGIAVNMLVAVAMVHFPVGFFMNWGGTQKGEGFEYHLLVLAMAVFLMVQGAGALSIDRALDKHYASGATDPRLARS